MIFEDRSACGEGNPALGRLLLDDHFAGTGKGFRVNLDGDALLSD